MAVIVECDDPLALLAEIYTLTSHSDARYWISDMQGDFTYNHESVCKRAWLRPRTDLIAANPHMLVFGIIKSKQFKLTKSLYSFYHAHFVEMLLTHFDSHFANIRLTALIDKNFDL